MFLFHFHLRVEKNPSSGFSEEEDRIIWRERTFLYGPNENNVEGDEN